MTHVQPHHDKGAAPWLALLLGLLAIVVLAAAWIFYAAPRPGPTVDVDIAAPLIPVAPKLPNPPTLPSRTERADTR